MFKKKDIVKIMSGGLVKRIGYLVSKENEKEIALETPYNSVHCGHTAYSLLDPYKNDNYYISKSEDENYNVFKKELFEYWHKRKTKVHGRNIFRRIYCWVSDFVNYGYII